MTRHHLPPLLAEIALEAHELTLGGLLAIFCVLVVLVGSLWVLAIWRARYSRGESIIPLANRPMLRIPVPLLIFGLFSGVMMASLALAVSLGDVESALRPPAAAVENVEVDAPAGNNSGSEVPGTELEPDVHVEDDAAAEATPDLSAPASPDLVGALIQTVVYDVAMILMLGIPTLFVKLRQQPVAKSAVIETEWSVDKMSFGTTAFIDDQNPYAVPVTASMAPSESLADDGLAPATPVEPWQLGCELRFAAEICAAAWLPTAILKLTMGMIFQDEGQHPFLEMISDGVDTQVLLLIAFMAVVLAPLMEELLYRVIILGGLLNQLSAKASSTSLAIGVTSVLFAFAHGFPDCFALLPLAAAIAWTYHQRRSYRTAVLVHFLFNGFNILIAGLNLL